MRPLRPLVAACLLAPAVGCGLFRNLLPPKDPPATGAVQKLTPEQLVGHLNAQAGRLQTIEYAEVVVTASEGDGIRGAIREMAYPTLRGNLTASQPRYFRMVVKTSGVADAKVDFGSNPEQFWVYFLAPTVQPTYVYASHTDFAEGRAKLPGGIPFEPDWVMQALGMITFPPNLPYQAETDEKARTHTLSWPATTPAGLPIRKEIVFAADEADPGRGAPQVRRHLVRDGRDPKNPKGKVICSADVRSARTVPAGGHVVQYPTEVELRYEEQKFRMTLKLDAARVNQPIAPQDVRRLFDLPNIAGANPVNLAHGFNTPNK